MVSLRPTPKNWTDAIAEVAKQFMNAKVCFYRETNVPEEGGYDPITGVGQELAIDLIWAGPARVQHLRSPQTFATDYQASANRSIRLQTPKGAGLPFLPEGIKARVLDAGISGTVADGADDVPLELLVLVVNSSINASHQAVCTTECTATMRRVDWTWTINSAGEVEYL